MKNEIVMGIQLVKRREVADKVQKLLTDYGCIISTRIGLHTASTEFCSEKGLIVLHFVDALPTDINELDKKLSDIQGVVVKRMQFE